MSRMKRNDEPDTEASSAWDRAHHAAAPVKPLARSTGAAVSRGVRRTRAWVAPQVERTGQILQDIVAPKVSAVLSSAARRLEPAKPPGRRWRKLVGISMLTAAVGAVAAIIRNRMQPDPTTSAAEADEVTPAPEMPDGQARSSTDADFDLVRPVRTS